ncbi:hypothetical protein Hanom_Chr12g01151511 [Helianthus anomalus]
MLKTEFGIFQTLFFFVLKIIRVQRSKRFCQMSYGSISIFKTLKFFRRLPTKIPPLNYAGKFAGYDVNFAGPFNFSGRSVKFAGQFR